ncbi:hypothetical protein B0T18DRAFT_415023 [Schizothecium vesticola]|uniref:Uncharacterized protein n=1 Tax=Schizothecium vesticola TaxID=314040 RepID=A0AA40EPX3_9PEZI|nr:hypothetical protein B0T18DRAFT_415023 [Schizothecium vesticola]
MACFLRGQTSHSGPRNPDETSTTGPQPLSLPQTSHSRHTSLPQFDNTKTGRRRANQLRHPSSLRRATRPIVLLPLKTRSR